MDKFISVALCVFLESFLLFMLVGLINALVNSDCFCVSLLCVWFILAVIFAGFMFICITAESF